MKPEIVQVVEVLLEYIDALPEEVVAKLPVMPGVDRDWVEEVVDDHMKSVKANWKYEHD